VLFFAFTACQKDFGPDIKQVEPQLTIDNIVNEVFLSALQSTDNDLSFYKFAFENCATVNTYFNRKKRIYITEITFVGSCSDKIKREGRIVLKWQKGWKLGLNSAKLTAVFDNFYYNGYYVRGQVVIGFAGFSPEQNPQYSIRIKKLELKRREGMVYSVNINELITFVAGFYTISSSDDILKIQYKAKGRDFDGHKFIAVAHDLMFNYQAKTFVPVSGTKVLQINGKELVISYGDGQLDSKFTVSTNGQIDEFVWRN
jgi:hypothetical protein